MKHIKASDDESSRTSLFMQPKNAVDSVKNSFLQNSRKTYLSKTRRHIPLPAKSFAINSIL